MKEFNYLYEKRRMLNSLGRTGGKCEGVACEKCPFNHNEWFDCSLEPEYELQHIEEMNEFVRNWAEEHPEPEVDWSKVPVDTKILVRVLRGDWVKRYFSHAKNGVVYAFDNGCTSWTSSDDMVSSWKYAKLAEE